MPTTFWLVDPDLTAAVARLESAGGVRQAEAAVPPAEIARSHADYAALRDALVPDGHTGPRPTGGVAGTRQGVKCLHAHLAWWLAGGPDPVGAWVVTRLGREDLGREDLGHSGPAMIHDRSILSAAVPPASAAMPPASAAGRVAKNR